MPFTAFGEPEDPLSYYSSTSNITDDQSLTIIKEKTTSPTATTPSVELSAQPVDNGDQPEVGGKSTADTSAPQISSPSTDNTTQPQADLEQPIVKEVEAEAEIEVETQEEDTPHPEIVTICDEIGNKLGSVSSSDCLDAAFDKPRFYSNKHRPLLEKHFYASPELVNAPRILFLGGIHGDEYSSVSLSFKWLKILEQSHNGVYDWHFMPLTNPDGLLQKKSTRVNANNVDLNRNFIPSETSINPIKHWQTYAKKRARYYPGTKPLSEPETQAIHKLIHEFKPDIIVSVHAPHGILDYDGGITPPQKLGPLRLRQLGTYPGSLGNYGWFVKQTPVMTIELKHAGIMPSKSDINLMWTDLIHWIKLRTEGDGTLIARKTSDQ
ncbi:murein peptide amidase A [Amphritea opalescens]|uniref:Murein peptide amidase A n=2 Tax=Amphritea opalescens TaxID=2490544 RepID=A0A430KNU6_9GAMM|nr:murein peptide amidase A [Amphritea opalescens]